MESKSLAHSTNMAKSLKLFRSLHFWVIFYYYCQELHTKIEIPRRIFILKNQYRLDRTYTPMFPRIKLCILYTFFGFQQMYMASRVAQNAWSLQILAPQLFFERFMYEMIIVWISIFRPFFHNLWNFEKMVWNSNCDHFIYKSFKK